MAVFSLGMVFAHIRRVTIAYSKNPAIALKFERERRTGIRHDTAILILYFDGNHTNIPPVGIDGLAVGLQYNLCCRFGGFDSLFKYALTVLIAYGNYLARLIDGLPF